MISRLCDEEFVHKNISNVWLTQKMMAQLYDVDVRTINEHISHIFNDGELDQGATVRNFRIVQIEGSRNVSREVMHYNLQMIIAVGFKVNNEKAVQFRKWANSIVKDYTIQGWVMDEERLKKGRSILTKEYFEKQPLPILWSDFVITEDICNGIVLHP